MSWGFKIMSSFISDLINRRYMAFHTTYPMQDSMLAGYKLWRTRGKQGKQYRPALLMPPSKYHQHSSSLPADAFWYPSRRCGAIVNGQAKAGKKARRHEGTKARRYGFVEATFLFRSPVSRFCLGPWSATYTIGLQCICLLPRHI